MEWDGVCVNVGDVVEVCVGVMVGVCVGLEEVERV
jgi:hypothetical protein